MKIVIVDDQRSARRVLRQILSTLGDVDVVEAASEEEALSALLNVQPDLVMLDVRLSNVPTDRGGLDVLRKMREAGSDTPVIMVTSITELAEVREALRLGAQDYIFKDELSVEMVAPKITALKERLRLKKEVQSLRQRVGTQYGYKAIVGASPAMERLRRLIDRVANSNATVLIRGPTGTGKELVARSLHYMSERASEPFIAVNCSTLPGTLIESLVFGHERGAFTGADRKVRGQLELAGRGTILLDEIAEMPLELQAKLLRVLEERRFRPLGAEFELPLEARVLASTHVDLERRLSEGRFREDLYYRLAVVTLQVPALAERIDDLVELLLHLTADFPRRLRFTEESIDWLARRPWNGNVRELKNLVERLVLLSESDEITPAILEELSQDRLTESSGEIERIARIILALPERMGSKLRLIERAVLHHAIEISGGNKTAAARLIGVDRKFIERKMDVDRASSPPTSEEAPSTLPSSSSRGPNGS